MKINYSNAMIIESLGKNYQMKQQLRSSNVNYLIAGICAGIFVGGVLYFIQDLHTGKIISNLKNQNFKLNLENERQRKSINELTKQSIVKPVLEESNGANEASA